MRPCFTLILPALALLSVSAVPAHAADADRFWAIAIGGKRIGYGHATRSISTDKSVKIVSDTLLKLGILGSPLDIRYQAIGQYERDAATPRKWAMTLTRGSNPTTIQCDFRGKTVLWTQTAGGQTTKRTIILPPGTKLVEGNLVETWESVFRDAPKAGKTFTVNTFETLVGKAEPMTFARQASQSVSGTMCDVWASGEGASKVVFCVDRATRQIVKFDVPGQNAVFAASDKTALKDVQNFDLTSQAFATTDKPLPPGLSTVTLKVAAKVSAEKISPASLQRAPTQTFAGTVRKDNTADGVFTISKLTYDGQNSPAFPYPASLTNAQKKWLAPDALTESDDPAIRKLAGELTAGSKTGWDAAAKIGHWVHQNIAYKITGASAKVCLSTKEGDCGPHTNLTIALCRAAGIPARMTGGALYTSLLGGSYGQHYWVRVWMGGKDGWIPIDPTSGEIGTLSPTHLTLWNAGALGGMTVKVIDYAPKKPTAAASTSPRRANGLAAGYSEKYALKLDGKDIGTQTATLAKIVGDAQQWTFALDLAVPQGGQTVKVGETGTFALSPTGTPSQFALAVSQSGISQSVTLDFTPTKAVAKIALGDQKLSRDIALSGGEFVGLGNNFTLISLALRSTILEDGKTIALPFVFADSLQPLAFTLTPLPNETLTVGGQSIPCRVYTAALTGQPGGEKWWVETATGALLKVVNEKAKLEIVRE